jgi:hypothetical protein
VSAWGTSWGRAWGNAWGSVGGQGAGGRPFDELVRRERERQKRMNDEIDAETLALVAIVSQTMQ